LIFLIFSKHFQKKKWKIRKKGSQEYEKMYSVIRVFEVMIVWMMIEIWWIFDFLQNSNKIIGFCMYNYIIFTKKKETEKTKSHPTTHNSKKINSQNN
jgi:hypothetical protein